MGKCPGSVTLKNRMLLFELVSVNKRIVITKFITLLLPHDDVMDQ